MRLVFRICQTFPSACQNRLIVVNCCDLFHRKLVRGTSIGQLRMSGVLLTNGVCEQMMITGQKPIRKSKQGSFQIVDIVENMRPITKVIRENLLSSLIWTSTNIFASTYICYISSHFIKENLLQPALSSWEIGAVMEFGY